MTQLARRLGGRFAAFLLLCLCSLSCSIGFGDRAATIRLAVSVPAPGSRSADGDGSRAIAAGTASFLVRLEGRGLDAPRETAVAAPVSGGTAVLSLDAVPFGEKTLTIFSRDGSGATISWGRSTLQVGSSVVEASVSLDQVAPEYSLNALGTSSVSSLAAGAVRVIAFTPPAESWNDYSISIMYSPCELSVFDSRLKRIALVGKADGSAATGEKWALVSRAAAGESFCVMIANTTSAPRSVQLRLERAYYMIENGGASTGYGTRESPYVTNLVPGVYDAVDAAMEPVRFILACRGDNRITSPITLREGKSLYGGFDPVTWNRDLDAYPTRISCSIAGTGAAVTASLPPLSRSTVFDGFSVDCGNFNTVATADIQGILIEYGSPIIANNSVRGANIDPRGLNYTRVASYGIFIPLTADSPLIAYNRALGGSVSFPAGSSTGSGSTTQNGSYSFYGIYSEDSTSSNRLLIGNEIIGWFGKGIGAADLDDTNAITAYGLQVASTGAVNDQVINNTIDGGRTEGWSSVAPALRCFALTGSDPRVGLENNLIGLSGTYFQPGSYLAVLPAANYSPFVCNFFFRASSDISISNYAIMASLYFGPSEGAGANIGIFPAQSGDFGSHALTGTVDNCNTNPAGMASDLSGFTGSTLSEFESEFILWDRSGKKRTIPYSSGCYERN